MKSVRFISKSIVIFLFLFLYRDHVYASEAPVLPGINAPQTATTPPASVNAGDATGKSDSLLGDITGSKSSTATSTSSADCSLLTNTSDYCVSYRDPQAGFPYHACKVLKSPVDEIAVGAGNIAKTLNNTVPSLIRSKSIDQMADNLPVALRSAQKRSLDAWYDDPDNPAIRKGHASEYAGGCVSGNRCAMGYELSGLPNSKKPGTTLNLIGDNICIPDDLWGTYLQAKIDNPKLFGSRSTDLLTVGAPTVESIEQTLVAGNTARRGLSILCFESNPYKDLLIDYIIQQRIGPNRKAQLEKNPEVQVPFWKDSLYGDAALGEELISKSVEIAKQINSSSIKKAVDIINEEEKKAAGIVGSYNAVLSGVDSPKVAQYIRDNGVQESQVVALGLCLQAAQKDSVYTALGAVPINDLSKFLSEFVFKILFGFAGAITLGCAIYSAIMIQFSQGGEGLTKARETLMHCLSGLALIIFAVFLLRFIGWDILRLPGLG